jgi:hypothetical protein
MRNLVLAAAALAATTLPIQGILAADGPEFRLELNKLETVDNACRVYFVLRNNTAVSVESYKPDLVFFDGNGVISNRLVVEGGPLPARKTRVKLFDVNGLDCGAIGSVLLNDVSGCAGADGGSCLPSTEIASRAQIDFIK